jgi:hypothetical protein
MMIKRFTLMERFRTMWENFAFRKYDLKTASRAAEPQPNVRVPRAKTPRLKGTGCHFEAFGMLRLNSVRNLCSLRRDLSANAKGLRKISPFSRNDNRAFASCAGIFQLNPRRVPGKIAPQTRESKLDKDFPARVAPSGRASPP